ncbi:MAG: hypothetical protein CVV45_19510 [Spirochaetae bacterium HGW-Spirochaetae-10]|nr:MAG: hypothetical protein CVV45_19510 [Spirochaetae bacterium HGW-Spirochaetae-10]
MTGVGSKFSINFGQGVFFEEWGCSNANVIILTSLTELVVGLAAGFPEIKKGRRWAGLFA